MFIIFILYHILYIIFQIKKQKNQFISLPIEEGDFLIRLLNIIKEKVQGILDLHLSDYRLRFNIWWGLRLIRRISW